MIIIACRFLSLLLLVITNSHVSSAQSAPVDLYVVPFSLLLNNTSDGSFSYPYSFLQQALDHIEREYHRNNIARQQTIINLYPTQYFVSTIRFGEVHSHTRLTTMNTDDAAVYSKLAAHEHEYRRLPTATISGGVLVTGWKQVNTNTYSAVVGPSIFVNQLFINNRRIMRTRVPMNLSDYLHYAAPLNDSTQALYGFQYVPGQFDYKSLVDAMVVVYHSWTESHHYIDRLITENNTVLFTNPSDHPMGAFPIQEQRRFIIENLCEALVPNSFCFVNETKTVYLMTDGSYDPVKEEIITSVEEIVISIAGESVDKPIADIIVDNIAIQHGAWNIARNEKADAGSAEFLNSAALFIGNAMSIVISNVEISHTGSYGLWIRQGTTNINFLNSLITDTGAGGIRSGNWAFHEGLSTDIKIISNEISYGGNEFPSGVGIVIDPSSHVVVANNIIHHQRREGIVIYSEDGYGEVWSSNVLVQGNYIHDIGQHILCDEGAIYLNGIHSNTVINGNVIKNVFGYAVLMWGIYLDDGASNIIVSNNIVYNTGWAAMFQHYGANNTIINNVFARASLIQPPQPGDWPPDGDVRIQVAENHTSWTFTRNIVYDTHQGTSHIVYNTVNGTIAPFTNNVYYNPYGTHLLFGPQLTSFEEWQKTGQDNGSVLADPLFTGDVNQCDFFTISSDSPAAKLGFVNLTKLSIWTPGCDMNDATNDNQFYHW
jgi:parallel beta-helix repeat protein